MARKQAGNINVDFDAKTAGLRKAESDVRRTANSISRNFKRAQQDTLGLTSGVRGLVGQFRSLAAFGGVLAGGLFVRSIQNLTSFSAAIIELGLRTGESTRSLQQLRIALESDAASLDISQFTRLVSNWTRVVSEAAAGAGEYEDVFRDLGLSARQVSLGGLQRQFLDVADAISRMTAEGRALEAQGLLTQLVGARYAGVFASFSQQGRLAANLEAAGQIPVPTQAELQRNKDLGQAFNDLANTVRNTLIIALSNAAGGLENFTRGLQRAIPAAAGGATGTLTDPGFLARTVTSANIAGGVLALTGGYRLIDAFRTLVVAIRALETAGVTAALRTVGRVTIWLLPFSIALDALGTFAKRFQALHEVSSPIDFRWLGQTIDEQLEGIQRGIESARARVAAAQTAVRGAGDENFLLRWWGWLSGEGEDERIELEVAEANLARWERANDAVAELARNEAQAAAETARLGEQSARQIERILRDARMLGRDEVAAAARRAAEVNRLVAPLVGLPLVGRRSGDAFTRGLADVANRVRQAPGLVEIDRRALGLPRTVQARQIANEFRVHEQVLANAAIAAGDALGDFVDAITDSTRGFREAMASFLRSLSRAVTGGVGAGLTDRLLVGLGLRASGGYASGLTLVGERGPELLDFRNPAMVYSNAQLGAAIRSGGGGGVTINYSPTINAVDAVGVEGVLVRQRKEIVEAVNAELLHRSGYSNPLTQRYDAPGF